MPKLRLLKYSLSKEYNATKLQDILEDIILSNEQIMFNATSGHKHTGKDGDAPVVSAGSATTIPVSATDTTPNYLYNKITVSGALVKTLINPGGVEQLQLSVVVPTTTTDIAEGTNLYFTTARARASISETVLGLVYDNATGVLSVTTNLWDIGAHAY